MIPLYETAEIVKHRSREWNAGCQELGEGELFKEHKVLAIQDTYVSDIC